MVSPDTERVLGVTPDSLINPAMLVEVLSTSTERYDRGAKFAHYRRLESLKAYLLVSQSERHIEHYRRLDDGSWNLTEFAAGQTALLPTLAIEIPIDEIYEGAEGYPGDEDGGLRG